MGRALWRELVVGIRIAARRAPPGVHPARGAVRPRGRQHDDGRGARGRARALAVGHEPARRWPAAPPTGRATRGSRGPAAAIGRAHAARPGDPAGGRPRPCGPVPDGRPADADTGARARGDGRRRPRDPRHLATRPPDPRPWGRAALAAQAGFMRRQTAAAPKRITSVAARTPAARSFRSGGMGTPARAVSARRPAGSTRGSRRDSLRGLVQRASLASGLSAGSLASGLGPWLAPASPTTTWPLIEAPWTVQ